MTGVAPSAGRPRPRFFHAPGITDIESNWVHKVQRSAIPSFFEIKEAGGVCALSEKNRIVGF